MNFFERQTQVRRLSGRLVALFALAVIGIVLAVDLIVVIAFGGFRRPTSELIGMVVVASLVTGAAIGLASLVRTATLRGGGARVALELGGVHVAEDTTDRQLRRLRNVVEEIAIASGVPVPQVYVLEHEQSINAFAAGWSPSDAAIAVTRGALDRLNRDELQGVIAHEFSHVVNGDMRLNIRLIGLLFGILFLAVIGRMMVNAGMLGGRSRNRSSAANAMPLIGLALIVAGFIGVLVGRLIKASVSRQREYLADAAAVQYTRQTAGLAGALKKIGGLPAGSKLASARAEEVGHMLFGPGTRLTSLFATHPPLALRIKALEPDFDPAELSRLAQRWAAEPPSGADEDIALGLGPAPAAAGAAVAPGGPAAPGAPATAGAPAAAGAGVVDRVAAPTAAAFRAAESLIAQIPPPLLARARRADTVAPLVFGLLLAADPQARESQYEILRRAISPAVAEATLAEAAELATLDPMVRLPLAQLAFPVLRLRHPAEQGRVAETVAALVHADGQLTAFEYCLSRLLHRELYESVHLAPPWRGRRRTLTGSRDAVVTLFAVLAGAGSADPAGAQRAFAAGLRHVAADWPVGYAPPAGGVLALEPVWPVLDGLDPADKARLVTGLAEVVGHDRTATVTEIELLRTVCALLHCPLPLPTAD